MKASASELRKRFNSLAGIFSEDTYMFFAEQFDESDECGAEVEYGYLLAILELLHLRFPDLATRQGYYIGHR